MKSTVFSILFLILLFNISNGFSQGTNSSILIPAMDENEQFSLSQPNIWMYKTVNNLNWEGAKNSGDYWPLADLLLDKEHLPADWNGTGLFRANFAIDPSLYEQDVALFGKLRGAAEIFVNGKLIVRAGKIGVNLDEENAVGSLPFIVFKLDNQPSQTIEIRYTNFATQRYWGNQFTGIDLSIGFPVAVEKIINQNTEEFHTEISRYHFIFGFMVALGLLHLILFGFYPIEIANLTCSVFFFCLSGIFLSGIFFRPAVAPVELSNLLLWKGVFHIFAAIVLQFFIYQIMNKKFNWLPFLNLVVGLVVLVITIQDPVANSSISYFFFMLTMTIGLILLIKARIVDNMKGTNIIFICFLVSFILVFPGLLKATFGLSILWSGKLFFMNFATITAAAGYSFYLARGVSITNRQLSLKLKENMKLTMEKLKAEKECSPIAVQVRAKSRKLI